MQAAVVPGYTQIRTLSAIYGIYPLPREHGQPDRTPKAHSAFFVSGCGFASGVMHSRFVACVVDSAL